MFQYKAVSAAGETQEGVLEGATQAAVIAHLQSTGLIPIRVSEVNQAGNNAAAPVARQPGAKPTGLFSRARVSQDDLGTLTHELATLLKAGLPAIRKIHLQLPLKKGKARSVFAHHRGPESIDTCTIPN